MPSPQTRHQPRHRPSYKKRYGQHHLRSGTLCRPLLDFLRPEGALVVEIGPGGGVLTAELARTGASVWALELDREWACHLARRRLAGVHVVAADALRFPWQRLPRPSLVAGNLPFNVGTRLIEELLAHAAIAPDRLPRLGFMVQKEVGDRLAARPGDGAYGALSVLAQAQATVRRLATVAAGSFTPPPKVDAAFVGLLPHRPVFGDGRGGDFRSLVHLAFSKRRKTLRNTLGGGPGGKPRAEAALESSGIDPGARAETLTVHDFVRLLEAWNPASKEIPK